MTQINVDSVPRIRTHEPTVIQIEPLTVTRDEAARLLGISVVEIDRLRASSQIIARRYGRRVLFEVAELRRFVSTLPADDLGK